MSTATAAAGVGLAGCTAPEAGDEDEQPDQDGTDGQADGGDGQQDGGDGQTGDQEPQDGDGENGDQQGDGEAERDLPTEVQMITEGDEYIFDPIGLYVEPGTTITWVNESGAHSSTAYVEGTGGAEVTRIPEDAEGWDSGVLSDQGATFEHTFETEGTYDYFCIPHKTLDMVARIVVGEPGGPAEGSMPPDGEVPESDTIVDQGAVPYDEFTG